jgi:hypothetical protein
MTPAELWERYRPKLEAAKARDAEESSSALLRNSVLIGTQWIKPISIESFLYLQAIEHPIFEQDNISDEDALNFLWLQSEAFVPKSKLRFFLFKLSFFFCKEGEVAEQVKEWAKLEFGNPEDINDDSPPPTNPDWLLGVIDILASEYGWSEDEIYRMPLRRAFAYIKRITVRKSNDMTPKWNKHADKVRHEYLKDLEELNEQV